MFARIRRIGLLILFVCALISWKQADAQDVAPALATQFEKVLAEEYAVQGFRGVSAAVMYADGRVWSGGAGFSDPTRDEAIDPDMRFGFASITKTYTAAVILQLVDEGVLTLDDRLSQWLPTMLYINSAITIRHLLGHTSGVYNFTKNPNLWPTITGDLQRFWQPEEMIATFVNPPIFFVGQGSGYSNTNYILLGMIIRAATGSEVSTQFRQRLLDPHGLTPTYLAAEEAPTGPLATTWMDLNGFGQLSSINHFYAPAFLSWRWTTGGMYSTSKAMAKWPFVLFETDLLSDTMRDAMRDFQPISGTGSIWTGYGLGLQQYQIGGHELWGHSGLIAGSSSLLVYSPEHRISIALVDNDARANHVQLAARLIEEAIGAQVTRNDLAEMPILLDVAAPYPNPFSDLTNLTYTLAEPTWVNVEVHDLLGRTIWTRSESFKSAGTHVLSWDGSTLAGEVAASGMYMLSLQMDGARITRQVVRY